MADEPTPSPSPSPDPTSSPAPNEPPAPDPASLVGKQAAPLPAPVAALTAADLALPEGFVADEALQTEFLGVLNKGLPPKELANELIKLQAKSLTTASEQGSREFETLQGQWRDQCMADPEFGGTKLEQNVVNISKLLDKFGDAEARQAFDITGAGNNPAVFRMMSRIAAVLAEPGPIGGLPGANPKTAADILYPNQGKQQ